ncbi:MAG: HD domain-containing protein [Bacteroidales bacterium]|nr:HD domain-containing protein [Bacteroidales bacterium]
MAFSEFTQQDYEVIAREYADLKEIARRRCDGQQELDIVQKAFEFANQAHKNVRRRSGEPYILHPIAVAKIVVNDIGLGCKSIAAALLHDVVEDTDYTVDDIRNLFGDRIASLVDGLTKIKVVLDNDAKENNKSLQAENFKRILLLLNDDVRVVLIKLADRLHNCRTIEFQPEYKRDKILSETIYIFIPLAHRLGLYEVKSEMENIWLRYNEPEAFNEISAKINRNINDKEKEIDAFIAPIDEALRGAGFKDFEIKKRVKSQYSIWRKMVTKGVTFEQIYDLYAVRIIFEGPIAGESERDTCYHIFSLITSIYKYKSERLRDWVQYPKSNGYEALHCTLMSHSGIWMEVQIRSRRMDEIAEKGIAAHWLYKKNGQNTEDETETDKWLGKVREILVNPDINALDLLDIIHNDLNTPDIYVFTHKGQQIRIEKGSTALDFAYNLDPEIGNKAIAAKVNVRLVPLSYVLRSGDQVEIITADSESPKAEWLDFLFTRKARESVSAYLKANPPAAETKEEETPAEKAAPKKKSSPFAWLRPKDRKSELYINDPEGTRQQYIFATCCCPIYGDSVVGFLNDDGTVTVHKKSCEEAINLASKYGNKIVPLKWDEDVRESFFVELSIRGVDRIGVINDITRYISFVMGININKINISTDEGVFSGVIALHVRNKKSLDQLIKKLEKIEGIESVVRTYL